MFRPWLQTIDRNKRILEIGPLTNPMVPKVPDMNNVYYADICSTEEVKKIYGSDPSFDVNAIVSIDYVIKNSYSNDLKDVEPFDYVLMSHVLEHIPMLIDFFQDIVNILKPDGKLCLVIPDKRYCFDHYRQTTSFAECYDIYKRSVSNNTLRILDFISSATINDPVFWWKNPADYEYLMKVGVGGRQPMHVLKDYKMEFKEMPSALIHYNVFTPETFLLLIFFFTMYNLFPFEIVEFYGTEENTFEFNAVLKKNIVIQENSEENNIACEKIRTFLTDHSDAKIIMEANKLREDNIQIQQQLDAMRNSRSWRITKPLRYISRVIKNA